ncbi:hypothetical protein [Rhizobium sp. AAP116]|uniref:hypothetical protein n=1 Tax=Rhizobium sp. AAP116 TaxID=1523429 RepID=UPI0012E10E18|nr:hypothetical protein [Rhizobium sp. AAP116]
MKNSARAKVFSASLLLRQAVAVHSFKRRELEEVILDLLRRRLMQPEAVAQFIKEYANEANAGGASQDSERQRIDNQRGQIARRLDGLYDAIADGLRTPGLKEKLENMEAQAAELDARLSAAAPLSRPPSS